MNMKILSSAVSVTLVASLVGCGNKSPSFTLLSDGDSFQQGTDVVVNNKTDILWVIDNSGSMWNSQTNLANNFQSFITGFQGKNLDFHMAVTTTEAFRSDFTGNMNYSRFRDGTDQTQHSGVYIMDLLTPNLTSVFQTNILQGVNGYGDERAFASFKAALEHPQNTGFLRPGAFLSIIIVSDEDDFSHNSYSFNESYTNPGLFSIQYYLDYLDNKTNSQAADRRYNVNTMAALDNACKTSLETDGWARKVGTRYMQLTDATGGTKASLCDNFADSLEFLSDQIIELSSQFYLDRIPNESTIQVIVNGSQVPNAATNPGPSVGGWTYNSTSNSILFSGDHIPPAGATINVTYDPLAAGS